MVSPFRYQSTNIRIQSCRLGCSLAESRRCFTILIWVRSCPITRSRKPEIFAPAPPPRQNVACEGIGLIGSVFEEGCLESSDANIWVGEDNRKSGSQCFPKTALGRPQGWLFPGQNPVNPLTPRQAREVVFDREIAVPRGVYAHRRPRT